MKRDSTPFCAAAVFCVSPLLFLPGCDIAIEGQEMEAAYRPEKEGASGKCGSSWGRRGEGAKAP